MALLVDRMSASERQQGHMTSALNCTGQGALVLSTGTSLTTGLDLASVGDVATKHFVVFVVDTGYLVDTEIAHTRASVASSATPAATPTAITAPARSFFVFFFNIIVEFDIVFFVVDIVPLIKSFTLISFV